MVISVDLASPMLFEDAVLLKRCPEIAIYHDPEIAIYHDSVKEMLSVQVIQQILFLIAHQLGGFCTTGRQCTH